MNLAIMSLAIIGMLSLAYAIVHSLECDNSTSLPARILSIIVLLVGYVGVVALIMILLRIPLS